jgi:acyl-CoA synthetase (AMP-forming)/AMP-acid ligase II
VLIKHCRLVMPHYMIPREVHVWRGSMPRTSSGKLARPDIVAKCREQLSRGVPRDAHTGMSQPLAG